MDLMTSFLTGSVLTLVVPLALLAIVLVWWGTILRRSGRDA